MTLFDFFQTIPDHRKARGKLFQLEYVLLFSVLAVLSGATSYLSIADWIEAKHKDLFKMFKLKWFRLPKKSCIQKIFVQLDQKAIEKAFREYSFSLGSNSNSNMVMCSAYR